MPSGSLAPAAPRPGTAAQACAANPDAGVALALTATLPRRSQTQAGTAQGAARPATVAPPRTSRRQNSQLRDTPPEHDPLHRLSGDFADEVVRGARHPVSNSADILIRAARSSAVSRSAASRIAAACMAACRLIWAVLRSAASRIAA